MTVEKLEPLFERNIGRHLPIVDDTWSKWTSWFRSYCRGHSVIALEVESCSVQRYLGTVSEGERDEVGGSRRGGPFVGSEGGQTGTILLAPAYQPDNRCDKGLPPGTARAGPPQVLFSLPNCAGSRWWARSHPVAGAVGVRRAGRATVGTEDGVGLMHKLCCLFSLG